MIKRFHEAPIACFKEVQAVTDGDYCLVHLLGINEDYYEMFKKAVEDGREVILDNSVFELGKSFNADAFARWVRILKPAYYIIPDVLENSRKTIEQLEKFLTDYPDLPGKKIGVVQGNSYEDLVECYRNVEPYVDKVAFSMDYSSWGSANNYLKSLMKGRQQTLLKMFLEDIINVEKPHHLLGVMLPQEMEFYRDRKCFFDWIDSVDTSNPVLHGLMGIQYKDYGLNDKCLTKMHEVINSSVSEEQLSTIMYNIEAFRRMCNGE